eukprot:TRINITY_DN75169_c0_g1_i1.p1 TRINITY_DN75169_c0_g1~~TRINITY_DN75169_c0_g1_i1.p1  ORF type:complete len:283 (-),score=28.68 TRINITY_DN75169_c0_g1_i1:422-1270(-)
MKVLFLDVDGVLHETSASSKLSELLASTPSRDVPIMLAELVRREGGHESLFRARAMACLAQILHATGAQLVLISSWRNLPGGTDAVNVALAKFNLPPIYSCTAGECVEQRIEHIWSWLADHAGQIEGYAVVDDTDLSEEPDRRGFTAPSRIAAHFVKTPSNTGLTSGHVSRLVAKLKKSPDLPASDGLVSRFNAPALGQVRCGPKAGAQELCQVWSKTGATSTVSVCGRSQSRHGCQGRLDTKQHRGSFGKMVRQEFLQGFQCQQPVKFPVDRNPMSKLGQL